LQGTGISLIFYGRSWKIGFLECLNWVSTIWGIRGVAKETRWVLERLLRFALPFWDGGNRFAMREEPLVVLENDPGDSPK